MCCGVTSEYGMGISKQQDKNPAESRQIAAVFKFGTSAHAPSTFGPTT